MQIQVVCSFVLFHTSERIGMTKSQALYKMRWNQICFLNLDMQSFVVLVFTSWLVREMLRAFNAIATEPLTATVITTMAVTVCVLLAHQTHSVPFYFIFLVHFYVLCTFYRHIECMVHGAYGPQTTLIPFISTTTHFFSFGFFRFIGTNIKSRIYDGLTRFIWYHILCMALLPTTNHSRFWVFSIHRFIHSWLI